MSEQIIMVPGKFIPFEAGTPLMDEKDIKKTSQVDSEDVKTEGGVLKFADKAYVPNDFSGMGRVYLRKNMINASLHFADIISDLPSTETETLFDCDEIVYETTNNRFLAVKHTSEGKKYYPNYQFTGSEDFSEPDDKHIYVCDANAKLYTYENGALEETTTLMDKNVLTQDMINKPNTIYIIQYYYDIVDLEETTTTNNLTIGGEYYSYKPITIADNQTYRALNDCVFVDYHHNSLIGSVLVTGENESQDFAIAKKSSAASGVPVSYYKPNGTINVPANCVLQFEGGSIKNGSIVGNGTSIKADINTIFNNVAISGTWNVDTIYDKWFEGNSTENLANAIKLCDNNIVNDVYISKSYTYTFTNDLLTDSGLKIYSKSNINIHLSGSINLNACNVPDYSIIRIYRSHNINIDGNGSINGDRFIHEYSSPHSGYTTHEWGRGIFVHASTLVTINGIKINNCTGDGITLDYGYISEGDSYESTNDIALRNIIIEGCRRNGITVASVSRVKIDNCSCTFTEAPSSAPANAANVSPLSGIDIEPNRDGIAKDITISNFVCKNGAIILCVEGEVSDISNICASNLIGDSLKNQAVNAKAIIVRSCNNVQIDNVKLLNSTTSTVTMAVEVYNCFAINISKINIDGSAQTILSAINSSAVNFEKLKCLYGNLLYIVNSKVSCSGFDCKIGHISSPISDAQSEIELKDSVIEADGSSSMENLIGKFTIKDCDITMKYGGLDISNQKVNATKIHLPALSSNLNVAGTISDSYNLLKDCGGTIIGVPAKGVVENTYNKFVVSNGTKFVETDGASADVKRSGTTTERNTIDGADIYVGFQFFDTTLSPARTVWLKEIDTTDPQNPVNVWVDATGTIV